MENPILNGLAVDQALTAINEIRRAFDEFSFKANTLSLQVVDFWNKLDASIAASVDNLTPLRRAAYRVLRAFGWYPIDALALIERHTPEMF